MNGPKPESKVNKLYMIRLENGDSALLQAATEDDGGVNGAPTSRRRLAPSNRPRTNGSPMSIEATNGDTYV